MSSSTALDASTLSYIPPRAPSEGSSEKKIQPSLSTAPPSLSTDTTSIFSSVMKHQKNYPFHADITLPMAAFAIVVAFNVMDIDSMPTALPCVLLSITHIILGFIPKAFWSICVIDGLILICVCLTAVTNANFPVESIVASALLSTASGLPGRIIIVPFLVVISAFKVSPLMCVIFSVGSVIGAWCDFRRHMYVRKAVSKNDEVKGILRTPQIIHQTMSPTGETGSSDGTRTPVSNPLFLPRQQANHVNNHNSLDPRRESATPSMGSSTRRSHMSSQDPSFDDGEARNASLSSNSTNSSNRQQSHMKENFVAMVSDELRTPVSALHGLLDVMMQDERERESSDNWTTLTSIADTLLLFVDNLFDVAKVYVDPKGLQVHPVPTDLEEVVRRVVEGFNSIMIPRQVQILPCMDLAFVGPGAVMIDRHRTQQILSNVLQEVIRSDACNMLLYLDIKTISNNSQVRFILKPEPLQELPNLDYLKKGLLKGSIQHGGLRMNVMVGVAAVRACGGDIEVTSVLTITMNCVIISPDVEQFPEVTRAYISQGSLQLSCSFLHFYLKQIQVHAAMMDPKDIGPDNANTVVTFLGASQLQEHTTRFPKGLTVCIAEQHNPGTLPRGFEDNIYELHWPFWPSDFLDVMGRVREHCTTKTEDTRTGSIPVAFSTHNVHLLLVEDNMVINRVTSRKLKLLFKQITSVADGSEAVDRYKSSPPGSIDAVLMDVEMPGMNGYEATKIIREEERLSNRSPVLIIAVTANTAASDREECEKWGMDEYLPKPMDVEELIRILKRRKLIV